MIGKIRVLFWLGIAMVFLPFFGIPNTWKALLAMLIGVGLIAISVALRKRYRAMRTIMRNLEHAAAQQAFANPLEEPHH